VKVVVGYVFGGPELDALRARLPDARIVVATEPERLAWELEDADALVCGRLAPEDTARARRLRLVQSINAGADFIDRAAVPPGAVLCAVAGHERTVAEWAVMALLAVPRRVVRLDRDLRAGRWNRHGADYLDLGEPELEGRTVAVLGAGLIGREVERLVTALGARAVLVSRTPRDGVRGLDALEATLREADRLVVAIALSPVTKGLVGRRELDALGADGVLVNVARGAICDERELYEALRDGRLLGAGLDVWWRYPSGEGELAEPSEYPFAELENVLLSPHASARSRRASRRRWEFVGDQLQRLARGEPLQRVIASS
jgi:phosphoglycerate dehydrogenase-like enzyme